MSGLRDGAFAGQKIAKGDVAEVRLKVSETVTHRPLKLPVTVVRGEKEGPTLFVTSAVHGDEINGVAVTRRLLDVIEPDMISGTLIGVPVVNRFGFTSQDRYLPDRRDLNRFFPGDAGGSMASRIANQLFKEVISISDAGIDLHTAAQGQMNLCHIRGNANDPGVRDLMRAFGTPVMMHTEGPKGSLRRSASDAGVPTVIFEAGEPSRFQHHVVEIGYQGVLRVMKHMGMIERRSPKIGYQVLVKKSEWVRADHGGLLDLMVEPGDLVRAKQRIATIHDPFGRHVDEILSPTSGVVLSTATIPLAHPGNAIVHIGHLHKTLQNARDYVKKGGDLGHVNWVEARRVLARQKKATKSAAKSTAAKSTKAGKKAPAKKATKKATTPAKKASAKAPTKEPSKTATKTSASKAPKKAPAKATKSTKKAASKPSTKKATKSARSTSET